MDPRRSGYIRVRQIHLAIDTVQPSMDCDFAEGIERVRQRRMTHANAAVAFLSSSTLGLPLRT